MDAELVKNKEIYDEAIKKLKELSEKRKILVQQRKDNIRSYIRSLEEQKIAHIRESLGLPPQSL